MKPHTGLTFAAMAPGDETIDGTAGAVLSSVKSLLAVPLLLPAASRARTVRVNRPSG